VSGLDGSKHKHRVPDVVDSHKGNRPPFVFVCRVDNQIEPMGHDMDSPAELEEGYILPLYLIVGRSLDWRLEPHLAGDLGRQDIYYGRRRPHRYKRSART